LTDPKTCFQWPNQGGGLFNTRHAYSKNINSSTISKLALKWQFNAGSDVVVTTAMSNDGIIYFPTLNGNFYALDAKSGNVLWARNVTSFISNELLIEFPTIRSEIPYVFSRMTPVITKHSVLVGIYGPAVLLSLNRYTGNLIWSSLLDTHPWALLTMSGTVHKR
jgi:outer membrane protein assembly factor BamB